MINFDPLMNSLFAGIIQVDYVIALFSRVFIWKS